MKQFFNKTLLPITLNAIGNSFKHQSLSMFPYILRIKELLNRFIWKRLSMTQSCKRSIDHHKR